MARHPKRLEILLASRAQKWHGCVSILRPLSSNLICLMAVLFGSGMVASAQTYDLSWHVIAGGGGTSSGANYTLSGTIGQPAAGHLSGGNYTIDGGFWGIYAAIQTPGAPLLSVAGAGSSVVVSWPAPSTGFNLQQNSNLSTTNWTAVAQSTNTVGGTNSVTIPATAGNLFFPVEVSLRFSKAVSRFRLREDVTADKRSQSSCEPSRLSNSKAP